MYTNNADLITLPEVVSFVFMKKALGGYVT